MTTPSKCTKDLLALNQPYPRTCAECGLGPCKRYATTKASGLPPLPPTTVKDLADILALFYANLKAVEEWYASRGERHEADVYVVVEIATGGVAYCLELAMKGESWTTEHAKKTKG